MRLASVVIAAGLLAAMMTSCGGGSSAEDAYREAAQRAVQDAALKLDNLPEGWARSEIGAQALAGLSLNGDCEALNGRGRVRPLNASIPKMSGGTVGDKRKKAWCTTHHFGSEASALVSLVAKSVAMPSSSPVSRSPRVA